MSKTIYNVTLLELLPQNLSESPEIIAVGKVIDKQWQKLAVKIKNVLTIADICNASPDVLGMLAVEMNIDFYDSSLSLANLSGFSAHGFNLSKSPMTGYLAKVIAEAVVDEIAANAEVTGVQPGSGTVKVS